MNGRKTILGYNIHLHVPGKKGYLIKLYPKAATFSLFIKCFNIHLNAKVVTSQHFVMAFFSDITKM